MQLIVKRLPKSLYPPPSYTRNAQTKSIISPLKCEFIASYHILCSLYASVINLKEADFGRKHICLYSQQSDLGCNGNYNFQCAQYVIIVSSHTIHGYGALILVHYFCYTEGIHIYNSTYISE